MKTKTRDYRFVVKLLAKERLFSKKQCKTIAAQLLENTNFIGVAPYHRRFTAAILIACTFNWHGSPQGYNYWYRIHCKLNKGVNVHGEYIGTSDMAIDEALLIPF